MELRIEISDGDSRLKAIIGPDGMVLYRPTKALTPSLEVLAESFSSMASTKESEEQALRHVRQAKDMMVLVGKDMCG